MGSTFYFVRSTRNEAGHPTGKVPPRDDVVGYVLQLRAFLARVKVTVERLDAA